MERDKRERVSIRLEHKERPPLATIRSFFLIVTWCYGIDSIPCHVVFCKNWIPCKNCGIEAGFVESEEKVHFALYNSAALSLVSSSPLSQSVSLSICLQDEDEAEMEDLSDQMEKKLMVTHFNHEGRKSRSAMKK
ncbi:uncharacterized protein G2W53_034372 [Senna tora]|uniref:Uncharacterized protein n=1 Tax=Senna tora TaxID=362788 RepID=A0A834WBU7_9FABA|nr:uncharacterized protein G2W53_034372 [Senna tora]